MFFRVLTICGYLDGKFKLFTIVKQFKTKSKSSYFIMDRLTSGERGGGRSETTDGSIPIYINRAQEGNVITVYK